MTTTESAAKLRRRWPWIAGAALAVIIAAAYFVLTRDVTVNGEVRLANSIPAGQGSCRGYGPTDDIREGAQIIVKASDGEVLGSGTLGPGQNLAACVFRFTVSVPSGRGPYQIGTGRRDFVVVDQSQLGAVVLTLG